MKKTITISVLQIIIISIAILVGYFLGKSSVEIPKPKTKIVVKWEKGETIHDTIPKEKLVPYEVKISDTIPVPVYTDTAKLFSVWQDYYSTRKYDLDFSNDSIGTFKVDLSVNQNKLAKATSTIVPNIRTVYTKQIVYKVPTMQIYGILGTSTDLGTNKIQFGVDLRQKFLIGASGIRMGDKFSYTIDAGIKF